MRSFAPRLHGWLCLALLTLLGTPTSQAAEPTNAPNQNILLLDPFGRTVAIPTNEVPDKFEPPASVGVEHQMPEPVKGAALPPSVINRTKVGGNFELFPSQPPRIMPYFAGLDLFGNTAIKPGALFSFFPLEPVVQGIKYDLSKYGLNYSLQQSFTGLAMSDVQQGEKTLGFYTFDFQGNLAVFYAPGLGTAGWISTHMGIKTGLGAAGDTQDAGRNIGSVTDPTSIWSSVNGARVQQLAWQESAWDGRAVLIAGIVNQGDYLDQNAYAQSGRSQFMNSALINSLVLPLPGYNLGLNLQVQPVENWYAMLGTSVGNAPAGSAPWTDFAWNQWSIEGEFGYITTNLAGWGPGIYRLQPMIAQAGGPVQAGIGLNTQQQLGENSMFGWFSRAGVAGHQVAGGASAQASTGLVIQGPFKHLLLDRTSNDRLGVGFVWSQPSDTSKTVFHDNEYIGELNYVMQLTPTTKLEPDLQLVWNPSYNPDPGPVLAFQIQLVTTW